jgi:hypothetical protein
MRRFCSGVALAAAMTAVATAAPVPLRCTMQAPALAAVGQPVPLRLTVANPGAAAAHVLTWGTPFEDGWFAPFVSVRHEGGELAYRGAVLKRGDPDRGEYLRIAPGRSRSATVDLAEAFDLRQPGRYRVEARIVLHDVMPAGQATPPRPRQQHAPQPLTCEAITFELR